MKPFGVISDAHVHNWNQFSKVLGTGVNNRLQHILNEITTAAADVRAAGGKTMYITGDLFHVRGSVSPMVLNPLIDTLECITEDGVDVIVLTGNHDLESRNSEALSNACESLRKIQGVAIVSTPTLFATDKVAMVPWFDSNDDVRKHILALKSEIEAMDDVDNWTLMLHVPVNGVLIGIPDHGFYAKELEMYGFKRVFSGHYHNFKEFPGEVYSVGATTHQTWNDVGTVAGHLIVSDAGVEQIKSSAPHFVNYDVSWSDDDAEEAVKGNYVQVKLGEADDDEVEMIKDHIVGLGALGCVVQAIPVPKGTATKRAAASIKAPTVDESIGKWVNDNVPASSVSEVQKLCADIMIDVRSVTV